MLIISLVNFINNNFLNSTVVKVVIKNKGRIHFSNNFKIRHFIFIRVCSLTNKCIEMKIRIGKSFDKETNEVFYQLQFKLDGERPITHILMMFLKRNLTQKKLLTNI
jgi:hypothetical protein